MSASGNAPTATLEPVKPSTRRYSARLFAARTSIGILDASTLGKIDIQGADAAEFLDRIYTNTFSTLKVGRCRYGLMCRDDGMVFDDGVTARIAENRFLMSTTTGGASTVLNWLEEWLQTEWTDLEVYCTSVTTHWAAIAVAGPKSRALVSGAHARRPFRRGLSVHGVARCSCRRHRRPHFPDQLLPVKPATNSMFPQATDWRSGGT